MKKIVLIAAVLMTDLAIAQQPPPSVPTDPELAMTRAQRENAFNQAAQFAKIIEKLAGDLKTAQDDLVDVKKKCGAPCEPKKEGSK